MKIRLFFLPMRESAAYMYSRVITSVITTLLLSSCIGAGIFFYIYGSYTVVDLTVLDKFREDVPSIVLSDDGAEITRFSVDKRVPVSFSLIPVHVVNAFVAAEDHNFWAHHGISIKGIVRSVLINCYRRQIVQGASTITQQLVKLLFFDARKTISRKIKEQLFSLVIEAQCTKEQIMQAYLNNVYFGAGIYGVEAAAQRFWGKSISDCTVTQAATLAAIVKSPACYCPLYCPLSAVQRRNVVLHSMRMLGLIDDACYQEAKAEELCIKQEEKQEWGLFIREYVRQQVEQIVGKKKLYSGGYIIHTTFNRTMQKQAEQVFNQNLLNLKNKLGSDINGALLCMAVDTGEIKAMIGGDNYAQSQFNRAMQAKRQFGSIFKPIIYSAAMRSGLTFAHAEIDEPLSIDVHGKVWQPRNYNERFEGEMTLAYALTHSNNIVTIKTLLSVGISNVIALAKKFHLHGLPPYPSLALGCVDGTLKEAIGMFNVFAHDGTYVEPNCIRAIKTHNGITAFKVNATAERVLSSGVVGQLVRVLSLGMGRLLARKGEQLTTECIGKTGTTNDCRTCWFCGSTPSYTTAVYIGFDDNRSMGKDVYPAATAFPIWVQFNQLLAHEKKQFALDTALREIAVNRYTGELCARNDNAAFNLLVL
ncbi:MAG: PBP1A family penicillin-binding protein [Candidatus Babeliales bacterium]